MWGAVDPCHGALHGQSPSPQASVTHSLWRCGSGSMIPMSHPVHTLEILRRTSSSFLDTAPQGSGAPYTLHVLGTLRIDCLTHLSRYLHPTPQPKAWHLVYPGLLQGLLLNTKSWLLSPPAVSETFPIPTSTFRHDLDLGSSRNCY